MDGASSDLRTGLPWQMVEIHEPMRLLCVVECTPEVLARATASLPEVQELVKNEWVKVVTCDPDTGALQLATTAGFVPVTPEALALSVVPTSRAAYAGTREHVWPVRIAREVAA
jgi:hypothetical protein